VAPPWPSAAAASMAAITGAARADTTPLWLPLLSSLPTTPLLFAALAVFPRIGALGAREVSVAEKALVLLLALVVALRFSPLGATGDGSEEGTS